MGWKISEFDGSYQAAAGLTSLGFLIIVLLCFMAYRYFEIYTVFLDLLPIKKVNEQKLAAQLIAAVTVTTTLLFMVHANYLAPIPIGDKKIYWSKLALVIFALVINYLFFRAWDYQTSHERTQKWFACIMIASFDYGFAHLFDVLRRRNWKIKRMEKLEQMLHELEGNHHSLQLRVKRLHEEREGVESFIESHTCPHCKEVFPSRKSMAAHKGICKQKRS